MLSCRKHGGKEPIALVARFRPIDMHLITIRNLRQDATPDLDVQRQPNDWNDIVKGANWQNLIDVQTIYRDAETVGKFTIFNIKGNKYHLIVSIDYEA